MDPLSKEDLRALAEKARTGELSSNERYDLDQAIRQDGSFGKELKRIRGDKD